MSGTFQIIEEEIVDSTVFPDDLFATKACKMKRMRILNDLEVNVDVLYKIELVMICFRINYPVFFEFE